MDKKRITSELPIFQKFNKHRIHINIKREQNYHNIHNYKQEKKKREREQKRRNWKNVWLKIQIVTINKWNHAILYLNNSNAV